MVNLISGAFELAVNLVETFMILWFLSKFLGCRYEPPKRNVGFLIFWAVYFLELSFINYIIPFEGLLGFIPVIIYLIYARCYLKGSFTRQLFVCIFMQAVVAMVAMVTPFVLSSFLRITVADLISEFSAKRVLMVVTGRLMLFYLFRVILQVKINADFNLRRWISFIIMPALTTISIVFLMEIVLLAPVTTLYALLASGVIVVTNMVTLYLLARIIRDQKIESEYSLMKQQQENIKKSEENMIALYERTCGVKHDLNDHLVAIQTMIEDGNGQEAAEYIEKLKQSYSPNTSQVMLTSNRLFNAIINVKLEICAQKGIAANISVQDEAVSFLRSEDMAALFGNLFNNAIEAAEQSEEKLIRFTLQRQGRYISVYVENSVRDQVLEKNSALQTTKTNKAVHGFGVKNIRRIVGEYDGMIDFFEDRNTGHFCCDILLKTAKDQADYSNHDKI